MARSNIAHMDFRLPLTPDDRHLRCRPPHGPRALWLLAAMIAIVLGTAAVASALTPDTRDFATKHGAVLATRAP